MKSILLRTLSQSAVHVLSLHDYESIEQNEILFVYDGSDTVAWVCVEEISLDENTFKIKIIDISYDGE